MSQRPYYLVINPGSGNGRSHRISRSYRALLDAAGAAYDFGITKYLDQAESLSRGAIERGYKTVVAVGGDGTINRVVNGFMRSGSQSRHTRLGILYSGTSPDFCRFHGLPVDPPRAVEYLLGDEGRAIDICRIRFRNSIDEPVTGYFASSANIGLGAGVAAWANRLRRRLGDSIGTFLASVISITSSRPSTLQLNLDGKNLVLPAVHNLTVGKNPYLAGGLKLSLETKPDDGRLYLFAVCGVSRPGLLCALPKLYSGSITGDRRFPFETGSRVRIDSPEKRIRIEFDGDLAGWCPAEIDLMPNAIRLIGGQG